MHSRTEPILAHAIVQKRPLLIFHNGQWTKVDDVYPRMNYFEMKLKEHLSGIPTLRREITVRLLQNELDNGKPVTLDNGHGHKTTYRFKHIKQETQHQYH